MAGSKKTIRVASVQWEAGKIVHPDAFFADLDLEALDRARKTGTVRNLNDRRPDVYSVDWKT